MRLFFPLEMVCDSKGCKGEFSVLKWFIWHCCKCREKAGVHHRGLTSLGRQDRAGPAGDWSPALIPARKLSSAFSEQEPGLCLDTCSDRKLIHSLRSYFHPQTALGFTHPFSVWTWNLSPGTRIPVVEPGKADQMAFPHGRLSNIWKKTSHPSQMAPCPRGFDSLGWISPEPSSSRHRGFWTCHHDCHCHIPHMCVYTHAHIPLTHVHTHAHKHTHTIRITSVLHMPCC